MEDAYDTIAIVPKNKGDDVRVALSEYAGRALIDVRTFTDPRGGGERRPTAKGVNLSVKRLPELIDALQAAAAVALRRGLIAEPTEPTSPWWNRD